MVPSSILKQFSAHPVLTTNRLVLKEILPKDAIELLEILQFKHQLKSPEEAIEFLKEKITPQLQEGTALTMGLFLNDELIGTCGYYRGFENDSGEIGYFVRPPFREKGYVSEAVIRMIQFGYEDLQLREITAYTTDDNEASIGVIYKHGFVRTDDFSEDGKYRKYVHLK